MNPFTYEPDEEVFLMLESFTGLVMTFGVFVEESRLALAYYEELVGELDPVRNRNSLSLMLNDIERARQCINSMSAGFCWLSHNLQPI